MWIWQYLGQPGDNAYESAQEKGGALTHLYKIILGKTATLNTFESVHEVELSPNGLVADSQWMWDDCGRADKLVRAHSEKLNALEKALEEKSKRAKESINNFERRLNFWIPQLAGEWELDYQSTETKYNAGKRKLEEGDWHKRPHDGTDDNDDSQVENHCHMSDDNEKKRSLPSVMDDEDDMDAKMEQDKHKHSRAIRGSS